MIRVCVYSYSKTCVKRPFSKGSKIGFQRERADLLALVGDVYCIFVTFPCGILGQVWYLIVSFSDLCRLSNFTYFKPNYRLM